MYYITGKSRFYRFKYEITNPNTHEYMRKRTYKKYNMIKNGR